MDYIKVSFVLEPLLPAREILYADLEILGFESMIDTDNGVDAFVPKDSFHENILENLMVRNIPDQKVEYSIETIEQQNWNASWESQFQPIIINEKCTIRAPFHESSLVPFDIVILPKMSFGTGHHETTFLMAQELFELDLNGKSFMDMGCGTGVLAIIAAKLKAKVVEGIDVEEWAYENSIENAALNNQSQIRFFHGDVEQLKGKKFDVIFANINRNILLQDMADYNESLNENGQLYMSGFYTTDVDAITKEGKKSGLKFVHSKDKNGWAMVQLTK
ncbi:MAG: 50S ribosomal protein L11 methyltransferase [Flavobacteriales bacterium]|nr:50S ribosomal protein L11 methyltransferase [Flavobacteriales bacterium]